MRHKVEKYQLKILIEIVIPKFKCTIYIKIVNLNNVLSLYK